MIVKFYSCKTYVVILCALIVLAAQCKDVVVLLGSSFFRVMWSRFSYCSLGRSITTCSLGCGWWVRMCKCWYTFARSFSFYFYDNTNCSFMSSIETFSHLCSFPKINWWNLRIHLVRNNYTFIFNNSN